MLGQRTTQHWPLGPRLLLFQPFLALFLGMPHLQFTMKSPSPLKPSRLVFTALLGFGLEGWDELSFRAVGFIDYAQRTA